MSCANWVLKGYLFFSFQQKKNKADKDLLYDRIADSYVALFTSINQDVKDKFLMVRFYTIIRYFQPGNLAVKASAIFFQNITMLFYS